MCPCMFTPGDDESSWLTAGPLRERHHASGSSRAPDVAFVRGDEYPPPDDRMCVIGSIVERHPVALRQVERRFEPSGGSGNALQIEPREHVERVLGVLGSPSREGVADLVEPQGRHDGTDAAVGNRVPQIERLVEVPLVLARQRLASVGDLRERRQRSDVAARTRLIARARPRASTRMASPSPA